MRLGFVVQRYGREVNGGAEQHCRMVAERLARRADVDRVSVFTSCARDNSTWANHFPAGNSSEGGVAIERFPVITERVRPAMSVCKQLMRLPHPEAVERAWVLAQGPTAPGLLRRLQEVGERYDAFVFFTYLYYPTVMGLPCVRRRVLVPTAHDEPPIRHRIYRRVFAEADALAFNTEEEQAFVRGRFDVATRPQAIVGCGVELADDAAVRAASDVVPEAPFVLYLGRLDRAKGVDALARGWEAFQRRFGGQSFQRRGGAPVLGRDLRLVLAGGGDMALPARADILRLGFVGEAAKTALLRRAELLAMPSFYESLSLVMLEAWTVGCPVLVNAECEVTLGHVERCAGGRAYRGEEAMVTELAALLGDAAARAGAATRGQAYVADRYAWPVVEERLMGLVRQVAPPGVR